MFENARRYDHERRLWTATEEQLPPLVDNFRRVASALRQGATVYINDAISAGNKDFTTMAMPLAMGRTALGVFARRELAEHVVRAREAGLVIFSGMKLDKLKQLMRIVDAGRVELILTGGSLAMALRQAAAERAGERTSIGAAGNPANKDAKAFVPRSAVERARKLLDRANDQGVRVVLPIDFILDDGSTSDTIPPDAWQYDIGPATRQIYETEALKWAERSKRKIAFHNGVMGIFENSLFSGGTEAIVETLKLLHGSGVAVYVGGGEGRAALERFGSLGDITHAFTAGGTILKCLAGQPLPFLEALAAQAAGESPAA